MGRGREFVSSPSHPFTAHDIGDLIYVSGGAKGWVPGWYSITKVAPSTGFAFVTPSPCPRCADGTKGGIWTSGPSEPSIVQVSTKKCHWKFWRGRQPKPKLRRRKIYSVFFFLVWVR